MKDEIGQLRPTVSEPLPGRVEEDRRNIVNESSGRRRRWVGQTGDKTRLDGG